VSSGLQAERTELAWLRTMLSCWVVALIVMRVAFPEGTVAVLAPVVVTVIGWRRRRRLKGSGVPSALPYAAAALIAGTCTLVAIAGVLM
jgi:uncharacterized membrane protein YidH (DUF202 family)